MKPKPVATTTICSECGLDWERHGDNPSQSDCIRLLRADLAVKPYPITQPVYPYVRPWVGTTPWWQTTSAPLVNYCGGPQSNTNVMQMTPAINSTACVAVAA